MNKTPTEKGNQESMKEVLVNAKQFIAKLSEEKGC